MSSDADDAVLYDATPGGVAILTFNRPDRLNAWGPDIAAGFYAALDRAEQDPEIRVIVLTGRGRGFCAGAYLGSPDSAAGYGVTMATARQTDLADLVGERPPHFVTTLRKPVIAAINGPCAGIGLTQALMCDVRFAAAGAKFAAVFARRGLIAEFGISWILPRLTSWAVALDLLLSGRTFFCRGGRRAGPGQGSRRARGCDEARSRVCGGHRPQLLAGVDGGDQAPSLRRRHWRSHRSHRPR